MSALDTDESPELFKTQIYSQTGVPPERQKIMVKGGILKARAYRLIETLDQQNKTL